MQNLYTLKGYLFFKWLDEDGDGINLVIHDERRQGIEACMQASLANQKPDGPDETDNAAYTKGTLDAAFRACYVPLPPESE